MKAFSPTQVKGDIAFAISIAVTLGFNVSNTLTIALLGSSALVCVGLNFAEAHVHVGKSITTTIDSALAEIKGILPAVQALLAALPGTVAAEVAKAIQQIEKGPTA